MPRVFKRDCDHCGNYYEGYGPKHCGIACAGAARTAAVNRGHTLDEAIHKLARANSPATGEIDTYPFPVRPLEVYPPYIEVPPPPTGSPYRTLHYSDVHFPYEDNRALQILYAITHGEQPDMVVCHGDLLDCYTISHYEKDPRNRVELQDEIQMAGEHLGLMASLAPNAERRLYLGNHEDRLRRQIWKQAQDGASAQILTLPGVWDALTWPKLLGADQLGWNIYEEKSVLFDKLILKHGTIVRKGSAQSAKAEYERYGKSGMSGHTHRAGVYQHRDWNGDHAWWEIGCMCDLNPTYMEDPDWQQSFNLVTWSEDRTRYGVEEIRIHDGEAYFRGKLYSAKSVRRAA